MPGELQPYVRMRPCPKCGFYPATTTYRAGYHGGFSLMGSPSVDGCHHPLAAAATHLSLKAYSETLKANPFTKLTPTEAEDFEQRFDTPAAKARNAVGQHHERECPNCKYQWAEAVVDA